MDQAADMLEQGPHESFTEKLAKWVWRGTIGGLLLSLLIHFTIGLLASFMHIGGGVPTGKAAGEPGGAQGGIQMAILTEGELDAIAGPQVEASTPTSPELELSTPVESELMDASMSDMGEESGGGPGIDSEAGGLGGAGDVGGEGMGGGGIGGSGSGGASFFGVEARGNRFAYIVDISGSMAGVRLSKLQTELVRSLDGLLETSTFIVIPYESGAEALGKKVAWREASNSGKAWARGEIAQLTSRGGTVPLPAFEMIFSELRPRPDAIYFMTDGEFEEEVVRAVATMNDKARIPIHCICYGSEDGGKNLRQIAKESRGTYTFVPE